MTSFGLFPEGLLVPTEDDLVAEFEALVREKFGPNFPLGEDSLVGFLVGVLAERLALCFQGLDQVHGQSDRDKATGAALRALGLLIGVLEPEPSPSTVTLTLCGDDGTLAPSGTSYGTPDTRRRFALDDDATLALLPSRAPSTHYDAGARATSSSRCYQCISPGTTSAGAGPSSTLLDIVDGTAHWTYIGEGTAAVDASASSTDLGPVDAAQRGITDVAVNPILGVASCTNLESPVLGSLSLSDEDFRLKMDDEIARPGTSTDAAVEADVARLTGVRSVRVFSNDQDTPDADGVPAHSFETMVQGGDDQEIRDAILRNKPSGIRTHGSVVGDATDDFGKTHVIRFSRPTEIPVYVEVTLLKDPSSYAGDGAVQSAVGAIARVIGRDAVAMRVAAAVLGVAGVTDVPRSGALLGVLIGTSPSPTSDATIDVTSRQLATYDPARVAVTSSDDPLL